MSSQSEQTYANHSRYVIGFHFIAALILLANAVFAIYTLTTAPSAAAIFATLTGIALLLLWFYARAFPLGVQDRVIRLEERLRLARLLPDDLHDRIESLSTRQLVAIRFASDDELADLTRNVLDNNITNSDEIKKLIKTWRPDNQRI